MKLKKKKKFSLWVVLCKNKSHYINGMILNAYTLKVNAESVAGMCNYAKFMPCNPHRVVKLTEVR